MKKRNLVLVLWCCIFSSVLFAPDPIAFDPKLPHAVDELSKRILASFPATDENKSERETIGRFLDSLKKSNAKTGRDALYEFIKNFDLYHSGSDVNFRAYTFLVSKLLPELILSKPPLTQPEVDALRSKVVGPLLTVAKDRGRMQNVFGRGTGSPVQYFTREDIFNKIFTPIVEAKIACCGIKDAVPAFTDYITEAKALEQNITPQLLEAKIAKQMQTYSAEGANVGALLWAIAQKTNPQVTHDTIDRLLNRIIEGEHPSPANFRELAAFSEGTNHSSAFAGMPSETSAQIRNKLRATLLHVLNPEYEKTLADPLKKSTDFQKNLDSLKKSKTKPEVVTALQRVDTIIKCLGSYGRMDI